MQAVHCLCILPTGPGLYQFPFISVQYETIGKAAETALLNSNVT